MFYVYILQSKKDNKPYYGFTSDLKARFKKHNEGRVRSTRHRTSLELIYYEAYRNQDEATAREKLIKQSGKIRTSLKKRLGINKKFSILQD